MDDIFVYTTRLPDGQREITCPCLDGYTVLLDDRLSPQGRKEAFDHAVRHINNHDFEDRDTKNVNSIERFAHGLDT